MEPTDASWSDGDPSRQEDGNQRAAWEEIMNEELGMRNFEDVHDHLQHSAFITPHCNQSIPSMGLLAVAYSLRGIRPALYASRPASTAYFIASAMAMGS